MGHYTYLLLPFFIFGAIFAALYVGVFLVDAVKFLLWWEKHEND